MHSSTRGGGDIYVHRMPRDVGAVWLCKGLLLRIGRRMGRGTRSEKVKLEVFLINLIYFVFCFYNEISSEKFHGLEG